MAVPQKTFIRSSQVTNNGSFAHEQVTIQQSTMLVFEPEPNPTKVVCGKITSKQMVACFICKTGHVATVSFKHRRTANSEWCTTICMSKVFIVHHAMQVLTYWLKSGPYWLAKTSNWLVIRRTTLTWHPRTSLYSRSSRKKCEINDFRHQKILLYIIWHEHPKSGKA